MSRIGAIVKKMNNAINVIQKPRNKQARRSGNRWQWTVG